MTLLVPLQNSVVVVTLLLVVIVGLVLGALELVEPHQQTVVTRSGKVQRVLGPGVNFVVPFLESTHPYEMRTQALDVPKQEVSTADHARAVVDAVAYVRITDPVTTFERGDDYRAAVSDNAEDALQEVLWEYDFDDVLRDTAVIENQYREALDSALADWGVTAEEIEIRDVSENEVLTGE